ncbi:MAG: hypothetical protein O3A47_11310, partial [Chloroflexi bacterium]|nr:hypothetical protein [Chloroflexota bacterium]
MYVLVAAVSQRDDERPGGAPAPRFGIRDQAELTEVDLGHLTRLTVGHAHRDATTVTKATVLDCEAVKRAVGHVHFLTLEQYAHLRER